MRQFKFRVDIFRGSELLESKDVITISSAQTHAKKLANKHAREFRGEPITSYIHTLIYIGDKVSWNESADIQDVVKVEKAKEKKAFVEVFSVRNLIPETVQTLSTPHGNGTVSTAQIIFFKPISTSKGIRFKCSVFERKNEKNEVESYSYQVYKGAKKFLLDGSSEKKLLTSIEEAKKAMITAINRYLNRFKLV